MDSSEDKFDVSCHSSGKNQLHIDMMRAPEELPTSLEKLTKLRQSFNWEIEDEREEFYCEFYDMISLWEGPLPNLQNIFKLEEIDCIVCELATNRMLELKDREKERLIEFMARCDCEYEPKVDEDGKPSSRRTTLLHLAFRYNLSSLIDNLFKIYSRFGDVNYTDESGLTHFHIACAFGCREIVENFLELGLSSNCLVEKTGDAALHLAVTGNKVDVLKLLLRRGADPNLPNIDGSTPLHSICKNFFRGAVDLATTLFNFSNDKPLHVDAQDKLGQTPLHLALRNRNERIVALLLRRDANPNLADAEGFTPLHIICKNYSYNTYDSVKMIFDLSKDRHLPVTVNAQDKWGNTPLHFALNEGYKDQTVRELLERNADPNLANAGGYTPLHTISLRNQLNDGDLAEFFLKVNDDLNKLVQIDARDNEGNTPLHLALKYNSDYKVAEILLKRRAGPNLVNAEGCTPLHNLCKRNQFQIDYLAELFFKITKDQHQVLQVDVKNKKGRTPLQCALVLFQSYIVDLLLNNGADLASFVFPTESHFEEIHYNIPEHGNILNYIKLRLVSSVLATVENLSKGGYELDQSDVLTIMKFFDKYRLLEKSADLDQIRWYDDKEFAERAKETTVKPYLSLGDLIRLPHRGAKELITFQEYFDFTLKWTAPEGSREACLVHLCEKLSRNFFLFWAMDPFMKLTHCRLPLLCCDMIFEHLRNKDLCKIFLAAVDRSS